MVGHATSPTTPTGPKSNRQVADLGNCGSPEIDDETSAENSHTGCGSPKQPGQYCATKPSERKDRPNSLCREDDVDDAEAGRGERRGDGGGGVGFDARPPHTQHLPPSPSSTEEQKPNRSATCSRVGLKGPGEAAANRQEDVWDADDEILETFIAQHSAGMSLLSKGLGRQNDHDPTARALTRELEEFEGAVFGSDRDLQLLW